MGQLCNGIDPNSIEHEITAVDAEAHQDLFAEVDSQLVDLGSADDLGALGYRFKCWTDVLCKLGPEEWEAGVIVKLDYSEPSWPEGEKVPYQVRLESGSLIFVPRDDDECCRFLKRPWWYRKFQKKDSYFADNPSAQALVAACDEKDVNEKDHKGRGALLEAVRVNWSSAVSALILLKADVDMASSSKTYPLHVATSHGAEMIKILLHARADPNCQDINPDYDQEYTSSKYADRLEHRAPLHYSSLAADAESVELLIKSGATLDIQDSQFKTPLHLAIEEGHTSIINILLQSRADVNLGNMASGMRNSPLMDAAHQGKHDLVGQLISAAADINKQSKEGMSALHLAARSGHHTCIRILLQAKADLNQGTNSGKTAAQLAATNGASEATLALLRGVDKAAADELSRSADEKPQTLNDLTPEQRAALFID